MQPQSAAENMCQSVKKNDEVFSVLMLAQTVNVINFRKVVQRLSHPLLPPKGRGIMGGGCAASTAQGAAPLGTLLGGYRPLAPA